MSKKMPIVAAKEIANKYDKDQVIILTWDKKTGETWVTTYGKSIVDCEQAAIGGNKIKKFLGWPDELCQDKPARIKRKDKQQKQ